MKRKRFSVEQIVVVCLVIIEYEGGIADFFRSLGLGL